MSATQTFGSWLRQRRRALDLTQTEIARLVGCAPITIRKFEADEMRPSKQLAELLAEQLEIAPDERVDFVRFARGERERFQQVISELPSDIRTRKTPHSHPNNLPAQPTPFIGRANELARARELILRDDGRLITLTGAGGCGKTRFALQVCAQLMDDSQFKDGVYFVPLAAIREPALVILTLAQIVGVKETVGRSIMEFVIDALHDKQMLLLLDNFEQVVSAAPLVAELLTACTRLKILATSREALHLRGEREFPVPPLSLPDLQHLPTPQVLSQFAAVELFIQRALAVKPNFTLTNENAPAVAEICARVDGLPLAIELAAARVKLLPPQAMLKRLENRLTFLTGGARDLPARQQTLRSTMDWSYDLLNESEQTLFNRMSVFVGGCTLEAAEAVCNADRALNVQPLDVLASLIDQNLLREEETDDEPRFGMLETIREYALERLAASGAMAALGQRHADYYLALAERADPLLETPQQALELDRLHREYDNLRAALDWFADTGQAEPGFRLAVALWRFWEIRGHLTEGRARLAQMLALPQAAMRTKMRMKALYAAGVLADAQCDYDSARSLFEENLAISREVGDPSSVASALINLGNIAYVQGNYELAHSSYNEALDIFRDLAESLGIAWSLKSLANVAQRRGDYAAARRLYEEELEMWRRVSIPGSVAVGLNDLGNVANAQGDHATARSAYEQSLAIFREIGNEGGAAIALHNLGNVVSAQGEYAAARALYEQSLAIAQTLGDKRGIAHLLESFANLAVMQAQPDRAVRLEGAAAVLRMAVSAPLSPVEQTKVQHTLDLAQQSLSLPEFAAEWAEGQALTLADAMAYAIEGGDSPSFMAH